MKDPQFESTVQRIIKADPRYDEQAYLFIREALDFAGKQMDKPAKGPQRHLTAQELLEGLRRHALAEYGPLTKTLLNQWGLRQCRDIGEVVFNLVNAGALGKTDEDRIEDFDNGYDFDAAFTAPFKP